MGDWTLWKWCILAIGGLGGLYGLHRLALRLEVRGHLYYLHKKPGGSAIGSFVALQRVLEPRAEHVLIVHEERTGRGEEGSGAPPLLDNPGGLAATVPGPTDEPLIAFREACFVPAAPDLDEPAFGRDRTDWPRYHVGDIAAAILSIPGMTPLDGAPDDWAAWRARWEADGRIIEVKMKAMPAETDIDPGLWNWEGSPVLASCRLSEFLSVWEALRARCSGVWLLDAKDRLWSPRSFAERFRY